ncbi:MAG: DNA-binding protein WhiA [Clostridia bacterium]|nr:DNA-binding protein WhiA [Clostridia bacterium]
MSFASEAREETANKPCGRSCCARSELCAALLCGEGIAFRGRGRYRLLVESAEEPVIRRYAGMLGEYWHVEAELRSRRNDGLNGFRYSLCVDEPEAGMLLRELQLTDATALFSLRRTPRQKIVSMQCCRKSFLKAAFLICGTISDPKDAYHLEFAAPSEDLAAFLASLLESFGFSPRTVARKDRHVVYLKKGDEVADALTLLEATNAVLTMENIRIYKDIGNTINRRLNCDSYNLQRRLTAAERRLEDIRFLEEELGLEALPFPLRQIARLQLEHPDATLVELGELLEPPLGKSGVNSRLRRLSFLADRLRSGETIEE